VDCRTATDRAFRSSPEAISAGDDHERPLGLVLRSVQLGRLAAGRGINGYGAGGDGVDVDLAGRKGHARSSMGETLRVRCVSGIQRRLSCDAHLLDTAEEDIGRGEEREVRVVVRVVVPPEEWFEPAAGVQVPGEAPGVVRLVLQSLELRFTERVVVRDMWAAETPLDPQRGEQLRERIALHRGAPIGVHRQPGLDAVASDRLCEKLRGQVL